MLLIAVPLVHLMDGNPPDGSVMDDIHASSFQCAFPIQLFLLVVVFFFFFFLTFDCLQNIHCLFKKRIGEGVQRGIKVVYGFKAHIPHNFLTNKAVYV